MEIKLYTRNDYIDRRSLMPSDHADSADNSVVKEKQHQENYDRLSIHADFSSNITNNTTQSVEANQDITSQRLLSLRQQIMTGAYQMDSKRIAECMLERRVHVF